MSQAHSLKPYDTFARLRWANRADAEALSALSGSARGGDFAIENPDQWQQVLDTANLRVLVAVECQILVGACIMRHHPSAALARLSWLAVTPAARGRGIGRLLLETTIDNARAEGAATLQTDTPDSGSVAEHLFATAGFATNMHKTGLSISLWNDHRALSYCDIPLPEHPPVSAAMAPAVALLTAMGALDRTLLMTHRAEKVLAFEIGEGGDELANMVLAAVRRGYFVHLDAPMDMPERLVPDYAERIVTDDGPLNPERLVGHLSRGHLAVLYLQFPRLNADAPCWYLVNGFDGYLFRIANVSAPANPIEAVTASEMRVAIQTSSRGKGFILAKVL